jgi:adenylate cyclase
MKSLIVLIAALFMNFLIQFIEKKFIEGLNFNYLVHHFSDGKWDLKWFLRRTLYWIVLFIITQLYLEVNNKYSPGVFIDVLRGKYLTPKVENRIVMFMDLKDSTTIAEKLGHQQYFLFIRDFINYVSTALIEYNGIIYQYVGDEVVVSWADNKKNIKNSLNAVIESRKNIQKKSNSFKRRFGIIPEFRVGIHVGEVTVGEIGVIKKDLAMSGDTMNTTARIRSACNELNEKFIVSKDFVDKSDLTDWQAKSLGRVELKGKMSDIELFSLKI